MRHRMLKRIIRKQNSTARSTSKIHSKRKILRMKHKGRQTQNMYNYLTDDKNTNDTEYKVAASQEVHWMEGKSWSQNMKEKDNNQKFTPKAMIRNAMNGNV